MQRPSVVELTSESAPSRAATARTIAAHGSIDILVNNAGITGGNAHDLGARARRLAPRHRGQPGRALPRLPRGRAADDRAASYGRIVNIASVAGKEGNPNASHYSASKAGLIALTKSLGKELADQGRARQRGRAGGGEDGDVRDR